MLSHAKATASLETRLLRIEKDPIGELGLNPSRNLMLELFGTILRPFPGEVALKSAAKRRLEHLRQARLALADPNAPAECEDALLAISAAEA